MSQSQGPEHTEFSLLLDNGLTMTFIVSGNRDSVKSYVMIALRNVDEVIEVFDLYQNTTLIPVRKVLYANFEAVR